MGREAPYNRAMPRALALSLADHVVDWRGAPAWPIRWADVFGRAAPLALEIGFGNGDFLVAQASARPERDHVGIELSWTAARYLFRRLWRARATNARVLLGDAEVLVRHLFAEGALAEVWVNHPCPWPKARHVQRRLLARGFLKLLAERMAPGAPLTIVTDHAEFADWLAGELAAVPALASRHATVEVSAIAGRAPTKYQERAMAQGIPIHYFEWEKVAAGAFATPGSARTPALEAPMPTLLLRGEIANGELFRGFAPVMLRERCQEVAVLVKLDAVFEKSDEPAWIVEAFAQEERLKQRFAIEVRGRGSQWVLKLAELGRPFPTHGVKRAIWLLGSWLMERHPGVVVEHENLGLPPVGVDSADVGGE